LSKTNPTKTRVWKKQVSLNGKQSLIHLWNIIHLFPLHKGDMKICWPEKSHISRGQRPREIWLFRGWANCHISLMQGKWMFYSTRPTFWWILSNEIFWPSLIAKLLFRNISGVIFTNMEYRYMTKALNLENFE
jgi:hypothetical protein